ncbi:MAG: GMC family oxidoreductase [Sphingobacteriales bacterium]|nr:MAG: GMC family oxidoreductase [Sphingobacteriales bacterium]
MKTYPLQEPVDAVVIGTGAGGAPILARLAQAGLNVIALEAGTQWNPATDFATDETAQNKLFWTHERLSAGAMPLAFGKNNSGTGVGGSTLHFTGYTPRPQPDNFKVHDQFGIGRNWPISYWDLEDYYDEVEQFLGVSGPSPYPWGPARKKGYPLRPLPLNGAAQLMERSCKQLGIRTAPGPNAILSGTYFQQQVGYRGACSNRGFCQAGCSTGAKGSADVTFIPVARHFGAEVRTGCFATGFERDTQGRITGVIYQQEGQEQRQRCKAVFLCAGAVETPRLLLYSGLANSSGQVGKNFMAHTGTQLWGEFNELIEPFKGVPATLISEDMHAPADADFASGYLLQPIGVMPVTYTSQLARETGTWGTALRKRIQAYNHVAGINIHGECLPYESNYLELSGETDAMGLPKPRIHFSPGENELRMTAHGEKTLRNIWDVAGARNVFTVDRYCHTIGTCRMGMDPEDSVVNPSGQSHDIPNLYISDNSTFTGSLHANPTLTIMALALRTADLFLKQSSTHS